MNDDGYLSRNRPYLAAMQRQRRARMVRIDYMPGKAARDAIEAMQARTRPGTASATNSAVIDAIVAEWAWLTGIQQTEIDTSTTSPTTSGVADQYARARMTTENLAKCAGGRAGTSSAGPEQLGASRARAGAKDFHPKHPKPGHPPGTGTPEFLTASARANESRLCHAKRARGRE